MSVVPRLRNPDLQGLLVRLIRPLPCLATRRTLLRRHGGSLSDVEWQAGILVICVCVGLSTWCWRAFCGGHISAQGARQTGTALTVAPWQGRSPPDAPPARAVKSACCWWQRSWTGGLHTAGAGKRLSSLEVDVWGGGCGCPFLGCRRKEIQGGPPCWPRERRCLSPSGRLGHRAWARGGPASCTGSRVHASC